MPRLPIFHKGSLTGRSTLVDDEDYEELKAAVWRFSPGGYVTSSKYGLLHRHLTQCPKSMVVDHINHDRLDNRRANLRVCTSQQNIWNLPPRRFKYGYRGIRPAPDGRWQAYITVAKREIKLGLHGTREFAALAHNEAAIQYYGEFAQLNEVAA